MSPQDPKYQLKSKAVTSSQPNYFVHFAMRYPVNYTSAPNLQIEFRIVRPRVVAEIIFLFMQLKLIPNKRNLDIIPLIYFHALKICPRIIVVTLEGYLCFQRLFLLGINFRQWHHGITNLKKSREISIPTNALKICLRYNVNRSYP